ncbi:hypothetical protein GIB67_010799 [Kingdonia uniflora]|uniref:Uncharacterized protein n=1 Tax=Kingdonia uniflora TaxID=39325 RepID=A0A7J7L900_9MAGN|nr:hypothetical protein GIB67_010799 [Kingdonia uniflora]
MRVRIKHRKPIGRCCSLSAAVWSLVGCVLLLHCYSLLHHQRHSNKGKMGGGDVEFRARLTHELEEIEEGGFQVPPPKGRRSPRAAKRRPRRSFTPIEEFLDEYSPIRHLFFPDRITAIDPLMEGNNGSGSSRYFYPGRMWLDTDGNPIQAHGGGVLYVKKRSEGTYYWYGENKDGPTYHAHRRGAARVDIIGVSCYSSNDLWTWKNEGIVLAGEETDPSHDLYKLNVLERPKVIYNDKTHKYVMWMHIDDVNYTKASVGVAVSGHPTGPFEYLYSKQPHGFDSRDMTIFKDDDGLAYIIYSSDDNCELHIGRLTDDYLDVVPNVMRRILVGKRREAPALFKHQGTYYMITSGCTGWAPNEALAHAAESIMGPWETMGNPCVGGTKVSQDATFFSQSTYVLPLPGLPGMFIFMADRWNPAELNNSRYVWLPLVVGGAADRPLEYSFGFPLWSRVSIYWHRRWRLPNGSIGQK